MYQYIRPLIVTLCTLLSLVGCAGTETVQMYDGPSLWGHERVWLPPEDREVAREMRMHAAANGLRAPVQVMSGNYQLMPGTCPWWDGVSKRD